MKKKENTLLLKQIIKRLEEIQEAEIISRKTAKILFLLILATTLYLSYCFISSSLDSNSFIQDYRLALISLTAAVTIGIFRSLLNYRQKKRLQRFLVSEIRIMIEKKEVPFLLTSLPEENPADRVIREISYDKKTLRVLVFILMLTKSKYILGILDEPDLIYLLEALRDLLVSEIEPLEDGQRDQYLQELWNQYLQELPAFEEFFANLS